MCSYVHVEQSPILDVMFGKHKAALDKASGVADWMLHDLRRTFATNLAALSTPVHVTERLLNHVSGTHSGIVAVYQRRSYMDEMREAVTRWEGHLNFLLNA
jgi:integrase